jgi:hypothetical protein
MTMIQLKKHWSVRLLCGLAVLLSVTVASADEIGRQRLRATIDVSEVFTPTPTPQVLTVTLSGTGTGQHFRRLTFEATELIDFRQFGDPAFPNARTVVTDGQFTITAANGDTLTGTYDGVGLLDPARPGFVNGTALARLTGGTGRFRCASGFAPFTLDINVGLCTCNLRLIQQPDKPGKMPSFQHMYEGALPWYLIYSSTSLR